MSPCLRGIARDARDTIKRLLTPDITTLWVVGFLLLCTFLLNTMVFQPILRIIDARSTAVRGAKELAESASQKAAAAAAEYDQKLNTARRGVRQMDACASRLESARSLAARHR
jgi:F0F1-type ATP synthase membrane subunit b/b'